MKVRFTLHSFRGFKSLMIVFFVQTCAHSAQFTIWKQLSKSEMRGESTDNKFLLMLSDQHEQNKIAGEHFKLILVSQGYAFLRRGNRERESK